MELLGEQVSAETVEGHEFLGKQFGLDETLGHEHVFANEFDIGDHDGDGSEQGLETFGQLGSSEIAGVHGDEHTAGWVE